MKTRYHIWRQLWADYRAANPHIDPKTVRASAV